MGTSLFGSDLDKDVQGIWGIIEETAGRDGKGIREDELWKEEGR